MRAEARCLRGLGLQVACSGADPAAARREAERLVAAGAARLLSFGLAAGLAPGLRAGDLILPEAVVDPAGERLATDPAWRTRLAASLSGGGLPFRAEALAGSDRLLTTPALKGALHETTGALAADMESHAVAAVARAAGLPFLVLRAVSDPADQALPSGITAVLTPTGGVRPLPAMRLLLAEPVALLRLAGQTRAALGALRRAVRLARAHLVASAPSGRAGG